MRPPERPSSAVGSKLPGLRSNSSPMLAATTPPPQREPLSPTSPKLAVDTLLGPNVGVTSLRRCHSAGGTIERRSAKNAPKTIISLLDEVPNGGKYGRRLSATTKRIMLAQRFMRRASDASSIGGLSMEFGEP